MARRLLLICGILSSFLYLGMNIFVPMRWEGYSPASQAISELSAIGAPTRSLWVPLGILYGLLMAGFGGGVWASSNGDRRLRVAGALLIFSGLFGLFWPPMHLRGDAFSLTDTLHIVWSVVTLAVMLAVMGLAAAAFGKRFQIYTGATVAIWVVFGTLTFLDAPRVVTNDPTPLMGMWERINIGAYMLWVVVVAVMLMRKRTPASSAVPSAIGQLA